MAESDIAVLLAVLQDLKGDVNRINDKIDTLIVRITQAETDIAQLFVCNSEVRLTQKKCQEDESAKIDRIVELQRPIKKSLFGNLSIWWNGLHILIRILPTVLGFVIILWSSCAHFLCDVKKDAINDIKPAQTAVAQLKPTIK
jgi:hypothetical protein